MKFYIGVENGSGQEFNNKEDFLRELSLMIDDCEANGGEQFDVTVDADASCFAEDYDIEDLIYHGSDAEEFHKRIDPKREICYKDFWRTGDDQNGYYCSRQQCFVPSGECKLCRATKESDK